MTRLKEEDIKDIGGKRQLDAYDANLVKKTGLTLKEIAMRAVGITEEEMDKALSSNTVAVVPFTCGQGMIKGFAETMRNILSHIGMKVFQPSTVDIEGLAEVIEKGAKIIFFADDHRFVALNLLLKRVVTNTEATARGYVTALYYIAGCLRDREVLVIGGAGRLGWKAVLLLKEKGAKVSAFDLDRDKLTSLVKGRKVAVEKNLENALYRHGIFFDATPATDLVRSEHIKPQTIIAAPGIPLGLSEEAYSLAKDRLIHDPLQIGVATMFVEAVMSHRR